MRISAVVAIFISLILAMVGGVLPVYDDIDCVWDFGFEVFANANKYFLANLKYLHAFMIICGMMIDVIIVTQLVLFIITKQNTWRYFLCMVVFYSF